MINGELIEDKHLGWCWKTRDGRLIKVYQMTDSHLRNAALFLMGMGYQNCTAPSELRIFWLTILRREWERRLVQRANSLKKWRVKYEEDDEALLTLRGFAKKPKEIKE